jgi:methylthioribose-1-phosphate isomerase
LPSNDVVLLLDQRKLPVGEEYLRLQLAGDVARAIQMMVVRGAPAIGVAAAYAMVLHARASTSAPPGTFRNEMRRAGQQLAESRPTAVNLRWAVARCLELVDAVAELSGVNRTEELAELARQIHRQDVEANRTMGRLAAERLPDEVRILTHCNAGALATGGYGTALGVVRAAVELGKKVHVYADETRPWHQGSRLTMWELMRDGISVELIADSRAASLLRSGAVDVAVVGSDRVAANGDVANKIGTYGVACLARFHERPFYVAAPWSTVDLTCASGDEIPIERRSECELTHVGERALAPQGARADNPVFDVTPADLVTALFTERGVADPPDRDSLRRLAPASD